MLASLPWRCDVILEAAYRGSNVKLAFLCSSRDDPLAAAATVCPVGTGSHFLLRKSHGRFPLLLMPLRSPPQRKRTQFLLKPNARRLDSWKRKQNPGGSRVDPVLLALNQGKAERQARREGSAPPAQTSPVKERGVT